MDDRIDSLALDHVVYHLAIADIALNEREPLVLGEGLEISQVAGVRQSVESDDYVAPVMLGPEMHEVGANESGGTRYKHPTHRDPFPRSFGPLSWWSKIEYLARRFASDRGMAKRTIPVDYSSANASGYVHAHIPDQWSDFVHSRDPIGARRSKRSLRHSIDDRAFAILYYSFSSGDADPSKA